jgi:hypothetical protein
MPESGQKKGGREDMVVFKGLCRHYLRIINLYIMAGVRGGDEVC